MAEYGSATGLADGWVKRLHPQQAAIATLHEKRWALYRARRDELFPKYLEPHRLEVVDERGISGVSLYRRKLGFSPRLAQGLIGDIIGHINGTKISREWGPLSDGQGGKDGLPTGRAKRLFDDATSDGRDWGSFFGIDCLEQILVTRGGVVVVDAPKSRGPLDIEQAIAAGVRPYVRLVDWSWVADWKWGTRGFEWVKLRECRDTRTLKGDGSGFAADSFVTYEFGLKGETILTRYDPEGKPEGDPVVLPRLVDAEGQPTLPVIPAVFGRVDSDAKPLRSGFLDGLDDIELDLANQINELRDEQRSIVFGILAYAGEKGADIENLLKKNSRFMDLGPNGVLSYVAANAEVLTQHLTVIDRTYAAWRSALRQKPAELMDSVAARSGTSFSSEFAVNWKPMLTGIAQTLDDLEARVLFTVAQFWGVAFEQAAALKVTRDTEFRLEDEASFLSRSIGDITKATDATPALPMARLIVDMMAAYGTVKPDDDIDALVEEVRQSLEDKRSADSFMNSLRGAGGLPDPNAGDPSNPNPPTPDIPAKGPKGA